MVYRCDVAGIERISISATTTVSHCGLLRHIVNQALGIEHCPFKCIGGGGNKCVNDWHESSGKCAHAISSHEKLMNRTNQ